MNLNYWRMFIFFMLCFVGCSETKNEKNFQIIQTTVLDSIPSASGIVSINHDSLYIVGDDATSLYCVSLKDFQYKKIPLAGLPANLYREPKDIKHDFESATLVSWNSNRYLLAFGSGSNSTRDSLLLMNLSNTNDQQIVSLNDFYAKLQVITHTDSKQWNIEGSAVINDSLFLLNRGNNVIITVALNQLLNYVLHPGSPFPAVSYRKLTLPSIEGKEARLSGASSLNDSHLLFSASVEDTPDWIQDGPVLGSFIGSYSIKRNTLDTCYLLTGKDGKPLKEKIESVDVWKSQANGGHSIVAVSDNDNGSSTFFLFYFFLKGE